MHPTNVDGGTYGDDFCQYCWRNLCWMVRGYMAWPWGCCWYAQCVSPLSLAKPTWYVNAFFAWSVVGVVLHGWSWRYAYHVNSVFRYWWWWNTLGTHDFFLLTWIMGLRWWEWRYYMIFFFYKTDLLRNMFKKGPLLKISF